MSAPALGTGKAIPFMTQAVLFAGDAMRSYGWLMLVVLAVVAWLLQRRLREKKRATSCSLR